MQPKKEDYPKTGKIPKVHGRKRKLVLDTKRTLYPDRRMDK